MNIYICNIRLQLDHLHFFQSKIKNSTYCGYIKRYILCLHPHTSEYRIQFRVQLNNLCIKSFTHTPNSTLVNNNATAFSSGSRRWIRNRRNDMKMKMSDLKALSMSSHDEIWSDYSYAMGANHGCISICIPGDLLR